jgi:thiol-disulfide isomerase/thioredoxin
VLLDRLRIRPAPEGMDEHGGKLELMDCTRAWIDPARGSLPLRIESRAGWRFNGKPLGNPAKWKPISELELLDIADVSGAFYPKHYTLTSYCADPELSQSANDIDGLIAGTAPDLVTVPYQRTTWTASTIEAGRPMPPSMFVPRFPDNASVADMTKPKRAAPLVALKRGDVAPEWQVAAWTDGRPRQLRDFRGKVVLLDFWGVWCGPCVQGLPAMELVRKKYGEDVVCLEIHTAGAEVSKVRDFLVTKGVSTPSAIDEGTGRDGSTGRLYGVDAWPHLVLIDADGKIAWTSRDASNEALMENAAHAAGIAWPPKEDLPESELHKLHLAAISMQIDKVHRASGQKPAR